MLMTVPEYRDFLSISGVASKYVREAVSFIQSGGLDSFKTFYRGEYKTNREKHLSFLMLNKYLVLLREKEEASRIWTWWKNIPSIDKNIRGDLHVHTTYSDGTGTLEELVRYAEHLGYSWIGLSDHSPARRSPLRITETSFRERHRRILELRETTSITIHESLEADISSSGTLAFPDSFRESLDFVIASLHEDIIDEESALKRIDKALDDPLAIAFAHPYYGVGDRVSETYLKNILRIIKSRGKAVEINVAPQFLLQNLNLADLCRVMDIPVLFSTDSHFVSSLDLMKFASLYYPETVKTGILNLQNSVTNSLKQSKWRGK